MNCRTPNTTRGHKTPHSPKTEKRYKTREMPGFAVEHVLIFAIVEIVRSWLFPLWIFD